MSTGSINPSTPGSGVEARIASWRGFVGRRAAISDADVDELEAHLRDEMAELHGVGLSDDEAFMVAVGRLGEVDALSREYAQERGVRLVPAGAAACAAADVSSAGASSTAEDAEAIRRALVAALGYEPDDLAGIIERALR